jgi:2-oxoglutarate/2-oxoacid ferredoxin oxidoreductase subunit beta
MMTDQSAIEPLYTKKDFVAPVDVRWCPGCGDYAILNSIQSVFPKLGIRKENFVIVSGIGCSSRFPYYMNTYGFHGIHGRAPTFASGVKVANPDLDVWVVTGDGDGLSIGGNHLLHTLRRNLTLKILMFNNKIYGLTKGQYSPTSEHGLITKSSPMGAAEHPINPIVFALASEATFVARTYDKDTKHMMSIFERAAKHKGAAFIEVLQNCHIFYDGSWDKIYNRKIRSEQLIELVDGKPLIFGKEMNKGIRLNGLKPQIVNLDDGSVALDDCLTYDSKDPTMAYTLAHMEYPDYPTPVGVFREIEDKVSYEDLLEAQKTNAIQKKGVGDIDKLYRGTGFWEVKEDGSYVEY